MIDRAVPARRLRVTPSLIWTIPTRSCSGPTRRSRGALASQCGCHRSLATSGSPHPWTVVPETSMFRSVWNDTDYGTNDLIDRFMSDLRTLTPAGTLNRLDLLASDDAVDGRIRWNIGSTSTELALEVKVVPPAAAAPRVRNGALEVPVLIAPFLSRRVRQDLEAAGRSYWDATGNMWLFSEDPMIVIRRDGAVKDPNPPIAQEPTRLRSLKGQAASEVIVGLLAERGRAGSVRDFARQRRLPVATVSRVFALLRDENFFEPTGGGPIVVKDRLGLARRWADDYSFAKTFRARRYYSILGPERAAQRLRQSEIPYAVTGVQPAQTWLGDQGVAAALPSTELWLYTSDVDQVEKVADLAPAPRDGTILVAAADFLSREHWRIQSDGTPAVTPWRTVGDLLSWHGRQAEIGEALANALIDDGMNGGGQLRA